MGGLPGSQGTAYGYASEWESENGAKPKRVVVIDKAKAKIG